MVYSIRGKEAQAVPEVVKEDVDEDLGEVCVDNCCSFYIFFTLRRVTAMLLSQFRRGQEGKCSSLMLLWMRNLLLGTCDEL